MSAGLVRPLHFGKLLPPPYAGIEAHVDLLLRALHPVAPGTLVACGDPADAVRRAAEFPYRLIVERLYGRVASAPVAPGMLAAVRRELASGRGNLLHLHAPNPLGGLLWTRWALSEEGQRVWAQAGETPAHPKVEPLEKVRPTTTYMLTIDDLKDMPRYQKIWKDIFQIR